MIVGRQQRDAQTIYYSVCTDNPFARMLAQFFDERGAAEIMLDLNLNEPAS